MRVVEGNTSVYQVYPVSRTTRDGRAEGSKGWRGLEGVGGKGISNIFIIRSHRYRGVVLGFGDGAGGGEEGGVGGRRRQKIGASAWMAKNILK